LCVSDIAVSVTFVEATGMIRAYSHRLAPNN
jgi:hypothetical protein